MSVWPIGVDLADQSSLTWMDTTSVKKNKTGAWSVLVWSVRLETSLDGHCFCKNRSLAGLVTGIGGHGFC